MNITELTKLDILGITYKIKYVKGHPIHDGEEVLGVCDYMNKEIKVGLIGTESHQLQTLCHEVLHAYGHELKIDVLNNPDNHSQLDLIALCMTHLITQLEEANI